MLKKFKIILIFVFAFFFGYNNCKEQFIYDRFELVQQWPQSMCWTELKLYSEYKSKQLYTDCYLPNHDNWTLHGLWPGHSTLNGPRNTNFKIFELRFKISFRLNEEIMKQLDMKMPSFRSSKYLKMRRELNIKFWKHEYDVHGVCALDHPDLGTTQLYFEKSIQLIDEYNVKNAFDDSNIIPGNDYSMKDLINATRKKYGTKVIFKCYYNVVSNL